MDLEAIQDMPKQLKQKFLMSPSKLTMKQQVICEFMVDFAHKFHSYLKDDDADYNVSTLALTVLGHWGTNAQ